MTHRGKFNIWKNKILKTEGENLCGWVKDFVDRTKSTNCKNKNNNNKLNFMKKKKDLVKEINKPYTGEKFKIHIWERKFAHNI